MRRAIALGLILLLVTLDYTLMAGVVTFDRTASIWSPWLYKTGLFTIADIIIIIITVFTIFNILLRGAVPKSNYLTICLLVFIYLFIGLIYNLTVFTSWKAYLYDFKVFLCLTVPYLFLRTLPDSKILEWFSIKRLLIYGVIAGMIDTLIAHAFFESFLGIPIPYLKYLNLPTIALIFPLPVSAIGILFARKLKYKMMFLFLFLFELVNHINKVNIGYIATLVMLIALLVALYPRVRLVTRGLLILTMILTVNLVFVFLISNPFHFALLAEKPTGAVTRSVQLENVLLNFSQNIPGLIGKGWGSTWFEYVRIPEDDIFSVGTSLSVDIEEAMALPVKFAFNWQPPAVLHKWGLLGTVLLCYLIAAFYEHLSAKIRKLQNLGLHRDNVRYLYGILVIACYYILADFLWSTSLRSAIFTSLLAFGVENEIRKKYAERSKMYAVGGVELGLVVQ